MELLKKYPKLFQWLFLLIVFFILFVLHIFLQKKYRTQRKEILVIIRISRRIIRFLRMKDICVGTSDALVSKYTISLNEK